MGAEASSALGFWASTSYAEEVRTCCHPKKQWAFSTACWTLDKADRYGSYRRGCFALLDFLRLGDVACAATPIRHASGGVCQALGHCIIRSEQVTDAIYEDAEREE